MKRDGKRAKEETRQDEKVMTWGKEIEGWVRVALGRRDGENRRWRWWRERRGKEWLNEYWPAKWPASTSTSWLIMFFVTLTQSLFVHLSPSSQDLADISSLLIQKMESMRVWVSFSKNVSSHSVWMKWKWNNSNSKYSFYNFSQYSIYVQYTQRFNCFSLTWNDNLLKHLIFLRTMRVSNPTY